VSKDDWRATKPERGRVRNPEFKVAGTGSSLISRKELASPQALSSAGPGWLKGYSLGGTSCQSLKPVIRNL
jgi:hypothetical protein